MYVEVMQKLRELVLSFHNVGPGDQAPVGRPGGKSITQRAVP